MKVRRIRVLLFLLLLCICVIPFRAQLLRSLDAVIQIMKGGKTVSARVAEFGEAVHGRLTPVFERIGVSYPPARVTLVGLKSERRIEVWVAGSDGAWKHLKNYPILGMSGILGPKLREGDLQVPEGIYRVESLNPNSRFHLALRVNYPNEEDRKRGASDGREALGSDIMIHGQDRSIGCLAMGDEAAEDLFVLAAETGIDRTSIILSPVDFRTRMLPAEMPAIPGWTAELYTTIRLEMTKLGESTMARAIQ